MKIRTYTSRTQRANRPHDLAMFVPLRGGPESVDRITPRLVRITQHKQRRGDT